MLTKDTFIRGARKGIETALELGKVLIPVYIIVSFIKETVIIGMISNFFAPAMGLFGLPGDASIVLVLGNLINIYGALGAAASLELTVKQITIIGVMLSFSHSLIVETAIVRKMGINAWLILFIRVSLAVVSGIILNILM
jgi:spore maturation protein SpmB